MSRWWLWARSAIFALLGIALASSFTGCGSSVAPAKFEAGPCPARVASTPTFANAKCGQLIVPENRQKPNGKTISISAAIIPSITQPPSHDPIFYIEGGPGGDAMGSAEFIVPTLNQDRDLVVLAQRGTLDATPALLCPEIDAFNAKAVGLCQQCSMSMHVAATKACHDRLVAEGVDLSAYNTFENINDFLDLRKVLNISKYSVFGTSYGTYVALTLMRLHPEDLESVIIDSVTPPSAASLGWIWSNVAEGFNNLFDACAAQPDCAAKYGDVQSKFTSQVQQLDANPLTVTSQYAPNGPPVNVVLDGGALVNWLVAGGAATFKAAPSAIQELVDGKPLQIAAARAAIANPATPSIQAYGLTFGVFCSEWIPFEPQSEILAKGLIAFPTYPPSVLSQAPQLPFQSEDCGVWNVPKAANSIRDVTSSSIPTLVLDGTFDAKTSPMWAKYAADTLSNSTLVIIPGIGHFVTPQSPCAQSIVQAFLDNPTTPPDTSCVAGLSPGPFQLSH